MEAAREPGGENLLFDSYPSSWRSVQRPSALVRRRRVARRSSSNWSGETFLTYLSLLAYQEQRGYRAPGSIWPGGSVGCSGCSGCGSPECLGGAALSAIPGCAGGFEGS